jgi:hypothetical protein
MNAIEAELDMAILVGFPDVFLTTNSQFIRGPVIVQLTLNLRIAPHPFIYAIADI